MDQALSVEDKKILLKFARYAIGEKLSNRPIIRPESLSSSLQQCRGCFVTLHSGLRLRGCIGTIQPAAPLIIGVETNAVAAAFDDPRFAPLSSDELDDVHIDISVLSVPDKIEFRDGEHLLSLLKPHMHGVILSQGPRMATFLPQVWNQLRNKEIFLEHLCRKAGLPPDTWQNPATSIALYTAEVFAEKDFRNARS